MIVRSAGVPEVFHQGWIPVTDKTPAKVGEVLIVKATDLGDTTPPVPDGKPFPSAPLLPVASAITVHVNGHPAEVALQIGWPEMVNTYRVDFRVPAFGLLRGHVRRRADNGPAVRLLRPRDGQPGQAEVGYLRNDTV